ncbi:MAG: DUF2256 domain-containing protein [Methylocystis sp.]
MPKIKKKGDLPQKICPSCGLVFSWRKKWTKNWESVLYCSERCRRNKKPNSYLAPQ